MKFTVLGANGFIGSACVNYLMSKGHDVNSVTRNTKVDPNIPLGHVIYSIGLTADFREKPFETVDAHVTTLAHWLKLYQFDSFLYLSSTRIYEGMPISTPVNEHTPLTVLPNANTLYNISKLMGEALCLASPLQSIRIVRLSNVYGVNQKEHNFLSSIIKSLRNTNEVEIREAPDSTKDYVALDDVVPLLFSIATNGQKRLYNVASGQAVSHKSLTEVLQKNESYKINFLKGALSRKFPSIDISLIQNEFNFYPQSILINIDKLMAL